LLITSNAVKLRADTIVKKIINSSRNETPNESCRLYGKAMGVIEDLKWPLSLRVAKILHGTAETVTAKERNQLIKYLLSSKYVRFRDYGYDIIGTHNLQNTFKSELTDGVRVHKDIGALSLLLDTLTSHELYSLFNDVEQILYDYVYDEDFEIKKMGNKYYSKVADLIPEKLEELKNTAPDSYVFVMKDAGKVVDREWAKKIYKDKSIARSLPKCYGEMGMWDVLEELFYDLQNK